MFCSTTLTCIWELRLLTLSRPGEGLLRFSQKFVLVSCNLFSQSIMPVCGFDTYSAKTCFAHSAVFWALRRWKSSLHTWVQFSVTIFPLLDSWPPALRLTHLKFLELLWTGTKLFHDRQEYLVVWVHKFIVVINDRLVGLMPLQMNYDYLFEAFQKVVHGFLNRQAAVDAL